MLHRTRLRPGIMPDRTEVPQRRKRCRGCQTSCTDSFVPSGRGRYVLLVTEGRIRISGTASLDPAELIWRVSRSGGPGGQHANTSETRVEVVLDLRHCASLSHWQRSLIVGRCGAVVRAVSADSRSQARNREIALSRLVGKLAGALRVEAPRRATKPSRGAREDRLRSKQQRANTKRNRVRPHRDED